MERPRRHGPRLAAPKPLLNTRQTSWKTTFASIRPLENLANRHAVSNVKEDPVADEIALHGMICSA